jgi:hypothetical protein
MRGAKPHFSRLPFLSPVNVICFALVVRQYPRDMDLAAVIAVMVTRARMLGHLLMAAQVECGAAANLFRHRGVVRFSRIRLAVATAYGELHGVYRIFLRRY